MATVLDHIKELINQHGGDREAILRRMFGGSCSDVTARQLAVSCSQHLGLSEAQFILAWTRWRGGKEKLLD